MRASDLTGLRRQPVQARSRERVAQILSAAGRLLAREGTTALTMRRLAEEAGVPIGSLYQFFEDRSAVMDAVVARHSGSLRVTLDDAIGGGADRSWAEVVDAVFDAQTERLRRNPAYVAVWMARELSQDAQRQDDQDIETIADLLCRLVSTSEQLPVTTDLRRGCRIATQMGDALLQLAFRVDHAGDEETLTEAKRVVRLYVSDLVERLRRADG